MAECPWLGLNPGCVEPAMLALVVAESPGWRPTLNASVGNRAIWAQTPRFSPAAPIPRGIGDKSP